MEKDLSPRDPYKGVTEDSIFHAFELDKVKFKALPVIRN